MPGRSDILPASYWHWALLVAGVATLLAGVWLLARTRRPDAAPDPGDEGHSSPGGQAAHPTTATELATALVVIILGYHLAAWGLPRPVVPFQIDRSWWWAVVLGAGTLAALSRAIDRWESRR